MKDFADFVSLLGDNQSLLGDVIGASVSAKGTTLTEEQVALVAEISTSCVVTILRAYHTWNERSQ